LSILSFIELNFGFVDSLRKDYWDVTCVEAMRLRDIVKVLFYQDYDPNNEDPIKRLFVLVLHDNFMHQMQFVSPLEGFGPLIQLLKQINTICLCMLVLYPTNVVEACLFSICCAPKTLVADNKE
jgi:hypothetical protein